NEFDEQAEGDQDADAKQSQRQLAENADRPVGVTREEIQEEEIDEDVQGPSQPVVRLPVGTDDVLDGNLVDARADDLREGRNEAVVFAEEAEIADDFAPIRTIRRADV